MAGFMGEITTLPNTKDCLNCLNQPFNVHSSISIKSRWRVGYNLSNGLLGTPQHQKTIWNRNSLCHRFDHNLSHYSRSCKALFHLFGKNFRKTWKEKCRVISSYQSSVTVLVPDSHSEKHMKKYAILSNLFFSVYPWIRHMIYQNLRWVQVCLQPAIFRRLS